MLDEIHRRKIDMADEVFVVDKHHYIGESTDAEIAYAHERGKPVRYWTDQPWCGMRRDERDELVVDAFAIAENAINPNNKVWPKDSTIDPKMQLASLRSRIDSAGIALPDETRYARFD